MFHNIRQAVAHLHNGDVEWPSCHQAKSIGDNGVLALTKILLGAAAIFLLLPATVLFTMEVSAAFNPAPPK